MGEEYVTGKRMSAVVVSLMGICVTFVLTALMLHRDATDTRLQEHRTYIQDRMELIETDVDILQECLINGERHDEAQDTSCLVIDVGDNPDVFDPSTD